MKVYEANFDGLVGPTHNYAGLSYGNIASNKNQHLYSNPKQAALQGLEKMRTLHQLGLIQGILPPQERPALNALRQVGFSGSDQKILNQAAKQAPELLAACYSASSVWSANAATVSPSLDTADGKVHFTPANLASYFHRSIEQQATARILKKIFHDERYFTHHPSLPCSPQLGDEGAANYTRFCSDYGQQGVAFFVFGKYGFNKSHQSKQPQIFPARQTFEASQAVARQHQLNNDYVVYAQQNPAVINQGVFHNDVISVGNKSTLFCHEHAFLNQKDIYKQLQKAMDNTFLSIIEVTERDVSVTDAINSYLFNSQLVTVNDRQVLIVPSECSKNKKVAYYLENLVELDNPIDEVKVVDIRQSMRNGGGPACLRLRVVLTIDQLKTLNNSFLLSNGLYQKLTRWIKTYYRDKLCERDLADPLLLQESRDALDALTSLLKLDSIYSFQQ
ncbi:MAG: N-succinylarginine dihydrolase [Endozoicomonas sp. (ex Botrylloides leachii)]|nr:N-succinylarginine dihydrolase [Endozoicomonas sp. (ex Botrylloides leachii)]